MQLNTGRTNDIALGLGDLVSGQVSVTPTPAPTPLKYRTFRIQEIIDKISEKVGFPVELVRFDGNKVEQKPAFRAQTYPYAGSTSHLNSTTYEYFWLLKEGDTIKLGEKLASYQYAATFRVVEFPGCCGLSILTAVHAVPQNKGVGTLVHELAEEMSKETGYTYMVVTDVTSDEPEMKIWSKLRYKTLHTFTSARTSNEISIAVKQVK